MIWRASDSRKWLRSHSEPTSIALSTNELATMLDAVLSGVGLAVREPSIGYRRETRIDEAVRMTADFFVQAIRSRSDRVRGSMSPA